MDALYFDSLTLFHDPALRLLYHRWRGTYNSHLFQPAVQHVKGLLEQLSIEYWIIDLNGLPNLGLEDQFWISEEVLPRVACLPRLRQLALVLSPNVYNQLAVESILHLGDEHLRFDVQYFSDADSAFDWLINPTNSPATAAQPIVSGLVA
ncbi:hypothetical protein [Solirubrum puertoriconensis]|uniref:STAS/SEC14 domain-containing protein n=1 Tax=Solirubrum puertoriconensis TaxID=1751427 RepID=A0A9X0L379_SOLP1|nr:hypothetical protein [Solirubrum puertoriconensis]KUG06201.1 hypothetical protein ASU33_02190 [Solirubrum puertoriconensis]